MAEKKQEVPVYQADQDDTITIPILGMFRQLKKYFLIWIIVAVVAAAIVGGSCAIINTTKDNPVTALVGFYYDGIEDGLDPNGNEFDANSLKAVTVIEQTLSDMGMSIGKVEDVRNSITISGIIPDDALDSLYAYKSIFDENMSISAAQELMNVTYYPTTFRVKFDYNGAGMEQDEAIEFLDTMLDNYKMYFIETYGTSSVFGTAIESIQYDYDYPQEVDEIDSTVSSLKSFINSFSSADKSGFRSTNTGYSFSDLSSLADTISSVDVVSLKSYIIGNSITRDKTELTDYYNYRIETLTRSLNKAQEQLDSIINSIENYEKDQILVIAGADGTNQTTLSQTSDTYDDLVQQKIDAQSSVSSYQSQIDELNDRVTKLKKAGNTSAEKMQEADDKINTVIEKVNNLVELTNETVREYYETGALSDAYSILLPATGGSTKTGFTSLVKKPLIATELLLFAVYVIFAIVRAFIVSYREGVSEKKKLVAAEAKEQDQDQKN